MRPKRILDPETHERWGRYIIDYADRDRILEIVMQYPGANQRFIKEKIQICWDVLRHHLKYLKKTGQLNVVKPDKRTERYFIMGPEILLGQIWGHYWQPHYAELIQMIDAMSLPRRVDILDLAESKDWPRSTTGYRLEKLVKAGLVKKEKCFVHLTNETVFATTEMCRVALTEMDLIIESLPNDKRRIQQHENIRKAVLAERREKKRYLRSIRPQKTNKEP